MKVHRGFATTTLLYLSMGFSSLAHAAVCDVDTDGDVDQLDLRLIIGARNTPAVGPDDPRDADGDGAIKVLDARTCVRQCNLPRCAIIDPTPPPPKDDAGQLDAPEATPIQNAVKDVGKPSVTTSGQLNTDIQGRTKVSGTEWKVTRGDTLYAIGRAVYPGDARKQARLRQDIMKLNPPVFANGANNMAVGVVLKLPNYVVPKGAPPKVGEPAHMAIPIPVEVILKPAPQPATFDPVVEPEPETPREITSAPSHQESGVVLSLGYSYGGDKLIDIDNWPDITAGSGVNLRLGYEQMFHHGSGYRLALGLQYNAVFATNGDGSFSDAYLQLAYQYRADPILYGIGVISAAGAQLDDDGSTTDYDSAIGAVVYLEYVGSGKLNGWGLSYTSLDIDEEVTGKSVDASRAELYYSWRF